MRKTLLLAAAATLLASAPATAKKPSEVRDYWTADRMANAKPAVHAKRQDNAKRPGGGGTTSSWSTLAVNWTAAGPEMLAHGKLFFSDGTYNYVCSGTAVDSTQGNVVWTAGHCVNPGGGAYYRDFLFVPAYNSGQDLGSFAGITARATPEWASMTNQDAAYGNDFGAIKVSNNERGETLENAISGQGRALSTTQLALGARVNSYGYPAEGKYNGRTMYDCNSYVSRWDTSTNPDTYGIPCAMNGGSSGGGWIAGGRIVSVNSYGYGSLKNVMFGSQLDATDAQLVSAVGG